MARSTATSSDTPPQDQTHEQTQGFKTQGNYKGRRIVGAERFTLGANLEQRYVHNGESVRSLAASTGRSYGFIHRVLSERGVVFRARGGAWRRRRRAPSA
jgi:hypothetical protein